jgi:Trypsin-co-occurring domain 2
MGEPVDDRIELGEVIEALRAELGAAVERGADAAIQFPVQGVEIEFQVGVTWAGKGAGKAKFWVLEMGAEVSRTSASVQTVRVSLGPPIDPDGEVVKVRRRLRTEP